MDYAVAALRLGAIDFLTKPLRPQNLLGVVRNAWDAALRARAASALPDEVATLARKAQELAAIVQRRAAPRVPEPAPLPAQFGATAAERNAVHSADVALLGMDRLRRLRREFPPLGELDDVAWIWCASSFAWRGLLSAICFRAQHGRRTGLVEHRSASYSGSRTIGRADSHPDPADARRDFVNLAPEMRATLDRYLEQVAQEFAAFVMGST